MLSTSPYQSSLGWYWYIRVGAHCRSRVGCGCNRAVTPCLSFRHYHHELFV